ARLTTMAITGRRTNISTTRMSAPSVDADLGRGGGDGAGLHEQALAQLEGPRCRHQLAGGHALVNRDLVALDGAGGDGAHARTQLSVLLDEDEDVLTVRRAADRGQRHEHGRLRLGDG